MASNLSTIGFQFADAQEFQACMLGVAERIAARADCRDGSYGLWRSRSGAEIWFHLVQSRAAGDASEVEICGLTPFYEGQSEVSVRISDALRRRGDNPFEGVFIGAIEPAGAAAGAYPIVFEAVDFALQSAGPWPAVRTARLTAFAHELLVFTDEADFIARRPSDAEHRLGAKAFMAAGLFDAPEVDTASTTAGTPSARAVFTGRVCEHRTLTNEVTGCAFVWMLVETLHARIDVVADESVIVGSAVEGSIVEVGGVMFGRLLDDAG